MTTKDLQDRLTKLREERDKLVRTLDTYNGAIQESEYWLAFETAPNVEDVFPGAEIVETASTSKT